MARMACSDGPRFTCSHAHLLTGGTRSVQPSNQVIERKPPWAPRHDAEGHRSPSDVYWPAVRNGQFNHKGHHKERERGQSRGEAKDQEDRKDDFRATDY